MSASVVTAALAAGEEPSPLVPPLGELIVGIIAFTLLYLFLRAKVFPIFERVYAERAKAIEGGMQRAHKAEEEAEALLVQYRSQLASEFAAMATSSACGTVLIPRAWWVPHAP